MPRAASGLGVGPRASRSRFMDLGAWLAAVGAVARRIIGTEPEKAAAILADLAESQQALVVDVRRLVEGLRPPVLDQLGLLAALREHASTVARTGGLHTVPAAPTWLPSSDPHRHQITSPRA